MKAPPTTSDHYVYEISDLSADPRFSERPYVLEFPHLRYYAGTPIRTKDGYNIGSLCVLDSATRTMTDDQKRTLHSIGVLVMRHLEIVADRKTLMLNQRMAEGLGMFVAKHGQLQDNVSHTSALDVDDLQKRPEKDYNKLPNTEPKLGNEEIKGQSGLFDHTFSRAGTIIREALLVDGVIFVDVEEGIILSSASLGSADPQQYWLQQRSDKRVARDISDAEDSLRNGNTTTSIPTLSQGTIEKLLLSFPKGTILNFDDSSPTGYDDEDSEIPGDRKMDFITDSPIATSSNDMKNLLEELQTFLPNCAAMCE